MIDREPDAALRFLVFLDHRDRAGAQGFIRSLVERGWPSNEIITGVLAAAQRRVGELWVTGHWSVSQEHASTAIVDGVLSSLSSPVGGGTRGRLVLACAEEEWHSLPARMLGELLRDLGWDVTFLGASADADSLGDFLRVESPVALLLSCSLPMNFIGASRMIDAAHAVGYRVLAGGGAFPSASRALALGADGWAATPAAADDLLDLWRHDPGAPTSVTAVGGAAAAAIDAAQLELVGRAMRRLQERLPLMAGFDDRQLNHTRSDFRYIIAFAAAAVLVQDHLVFEEFLDWLAAILTRVGLPRILDLSLDTLASVSPEHPQLLSVLASGRSHLGNGTDTR
ncbi:MAG: binding domain protein [Frankiales bacterium]|nr:binding domain protein [Frankiales bacterium]